MKNRTNHGDPRGMEPPNVKAERDDTMGRRRGPGPATSLQATFASGADLQAPASGIGPLELCVDATNDDGELAPWLDDAWWAARIREYGERPVTVRWRPTAGALLHPVILYQVSMLRRVVPTWRQVGYGYADDVVTDDDVETLAGSSYHEVRLYDGSRPNRREADRCSWHRPIGELFGRVQVARAGLAGPPPVLVRLPAPDRRA